MSFANFVGNTPLGDTTRIDTLITEKIKRVSAFQNIDIEGDVDLGLTGRIVGTLGVETTQLTTQMGTVATLTGNDINFFGKMNFETGAVAINTGDFVGDLSGAVVCIGDISGSVDSSVVINATGTPMVAVEPNGCYIAPMRGVDLGITQFLVKYDPTTGELVYSTTPEPGP